MRWKSGGGITSSLFNGSGPGRSSSGDEGVGSTGSLGLLVVETGGGDSPRRWRRRGKVREGWSLSRLPEGLAVREVDREMVGKGRTSSEVLLNLFTSSLKEGWRALEEVEGTDADGPLKADESEVDRYAGRLARE